MENTLKESTDLKEQMVSDFKLLESSLNGEAATPLHKLRQKAIEAFNEAGFPGRKNEEWKYTNVTPIIKSEFKQVPQRSKTSLKLKDIEQFLVAGLDANIIVIVNGSYVPELSNIKSAGQNLYIGGFEDAMEKYKDVFNEHLAKYARYEGKGFTALNTAFIKDGVFVYVPKGMAVEEPVHIINIADGRENSLMVQPRNLFVAEPSSSVKIFEEYHTLGENKFCTNTVSEIVVKENAFLDYYKVQNDSESAYHIGTAEVIQEKNSNFNSVTVSWGGSIIRNDLNAVLNGENSECHFYGLYLLRNKEHVDNHTLADHAVPNCFSNELYKGIIDDSSTGVFNGKIMVRKDAQKTNAYQSNKNILLTDTAKINAKPQLEIFADDVKCSHGATTGQIDKDSLFYLRARGISEADAKRLLLYAFAYDVLDAVKSDEIKSYLAAKLEKKLSRKK